MPRMHVREVLLDTSHFNPFQLQTRFVLQCCMNGWAGWARDNLAPFRDLIREHAFGLVVVGVQVVWTQPFGFFDADAVEVRTSIGIRKDRRLMHGNAGFYSGAGEVVRSVHLMRPVRLVDSSLAAQPAAVDESIFSRFEPDEILAPARREADRQVAEFEGRGERVGQWTRELRIHRDDTEVADQWSYIEVPGLAAAAREDLVLSGAYPTLAQSLGRSLARLDMKLMRPLYVFDRALVDTEAFRIDDTFGFVHRIRSDAGGGHEHAVVVERLAGKQDAA